MKNKNAYDRRTKEQTESLMGFASANAKAIALSYTTSVILEAHHENSRKAKNNNEKLDRVKIIQQVIDKLRRDYIKYCVRPVIATIENVIVCNTIGFNLNHLYFLLKLF